MRNTNEEFLALNCGHSLEDIYCKRCGAKLEKEYLTPHYDVKTGEKILVYQWVCTNTNWIKKLFSNTCENTLGW